ncbi:hypothetical protein L596_027054 [Steinernema carpocapsae]|uniref:Uncharacterized protein n=1 Tax=Steinernema carpocapsae TaxID=34508 RepID=A0A4V5ZYC7_STECR|nr:hypothetical protein L596_027054 [Steinernema carpocapsae]
MPSKFKDGTDIEEYRKQAVELMDFLGMPINKVELGIQKDDSKILSDQWDLVIANGLDPDATWEYLLRWFALSARLKAHTCFDFVLDCMAQQDYLNLFKNDKAILLSLVLFSCYTEGLALMFSHEALSNVLDINETFENKNFFFTEYQSTRPNTILGVIAYGRLKPGLIDMLDVALELGAKMYVENSNSPVHLAISSGNYQALKILARYSLTEIICELAFVNLDTIPFEIQNWIMAIWNGGRKEVEQLRDFLPNRPVARETANRFFPTAMSWATLEELHKHPTLYPGDIIECKISNLEKQQIVFLGKERIDGKTVKKCDSDLNTRGCVFTGSTCDDEYKNFRIGRNTSKKATIDVIFEALETAAY